MMVKVPWRGVPKGGEKEEPKGEAAQRAPPIRKGEVKVDAPQPPIRRAARIEGESNG